LTYEFRLFSAIKLVNVMEDAKVNGFSRIKHSVFAAVLLCTASCSWIQSRQSLFTDEESEAAKPAVATTVPKEQYDQLLKKYEVLQTRLQTVEAGDPTESLHSEAPASEDKEALIGALQNADQAELAETVDVFATGNTAAQTKVASEDYSNVDVEA